MEIKAHENDSLIYFIILWLKTLKYYSKIFIEMSSLNTNIREFLSGDDENLILKALYFIWTKTNKKIESCTFDQDSDRVRISFKGIGYVYFDLQETFNKV